MAAPFDTLELRKMVDEMRNAYGHHNPVCVLCFTLEKAASEIDELRDALKPFGQNVGAESLVEALGHITRDNMERARDLAYSD